MKISLDFDDTYTLDPQFWNMFIVHTLQRGHEVKIVTYRKSTMIDPQFKVLEDDYGIEIIFTEYTQKRAYCRMIGWEPDVWIDDSPEFIVDHTVIVGEKV